MHEKIRTVTLKNVIIAVWWIVISLAVSLHCSDEALAAELLPAVAAEEGAEDTLQEQSAAPAESAGQQERPEASDAVQHASVKDSAAEENTGASDTTAPAAEEADMTAAAVEEGDMTTAAAVTSATASIVFPADQIDDDGDDDRQKRRANEKIAPVFAKPFH